MRERLVQGIAHEGIMMGVNTWAAFAGTDAAAVIDGDFAMTEGELQTVLKAMRKEGIRRRRSSSHKCR
jgi:hypothetical protein